MLRVVPSLFQLPYFSLGDRCLCYIPLWTGKQVQCHDVCLQPGMIVTTSVTATSGSNVNSVKGSTNGNKSQSIQGPTQGQATALVGGKPAVMSAQAAAQPLVLGQIGRCGSGPRTNHEITRDSLVQ